MQGLYSIGLLIVSNVFMTLAWYGHLKLQEMKVINNWPSCIQTDVWRRGIRDRCDQRLNFSGDARTPFKI